jgi:hypothetical protein
LEHRCYWKINENQHNVRDTQESAISIPASASLQLQSDNFHEVAGLGRGGSGALWRTTKEKKVKKMLERVFFHITEMMHIISTLYACFCMLGFSICNYLPSERLSFQWKADIKWETIFFKVLWIVVLMNRLRLFFVTGER